MFSEVFQQLGLAKNEARIYEALIVEGEQSVAEISKRSKVHRRNVYDSLDRLMHKGLVFEIQQKYESRFQAVDPSRLMDVIDEKKELLSRALPQLHDYFHKVPRQNKVLIYRGIEGWKNYMRDILRVGEDFYCIGGKGAWLDPRLQEFLPKFLREAVSRKIKYHYLFDHEIKDSGLDIVKMVGENHRFLPPGYSAPACLDVFGPQVTILTDIKIGHIAEESQFTVIVDNQVAESFRIWFRYMWDFLPQSGSQKAPPVSGVPRAIANS